MAVIAAAMSSRAGNGTEGCGADAHRGVLTPGTGASQLSINMVSMVHVFIQNHNKRELIVVAPLSAAVSTHQARTGRRLCVLVPHSGARHVQR